MVGNYYVQEARNYAREKMDYIFDYKEREALLQAEFGRVVIPPHAMKLDQQAIQDTLASYPRRSVMSFTLHGCEQLRADPHLQHPMVRVSLVNLTTGELVEHSEDKISEFARIYGAECAGARAGDSQQGSRPRHANGLLQPVLSRPCNLKGTGNLVPQWEMEHLLFDEHLEHLLTPQSLILVEVVDFSP